MVWAEEHGEIRRRNSMETDPKTRLQDVKVRLAELKQEREALKAEQEQLRATLGREPGGRRAREGAEDAD